VIVAREEVCSQHVFSTVFSRAVSWRSVSVEIAVGSVAKEEFRSKSVFGRFCLDRNVNFPADEPRKERKREDLS
jgi:hypothetical protein